VLDWMVARNLDNFPVSAAINLSEHLEDGRGKL
jgi:hypothetical protein